MPAETLPAPTKSKPAKAEKPLAPEAAPATTIAPPPDKSELSQPNKFPVPVGLGLSEALKKISAGTAVEDLEKDVPEKPVEKPAEARVEVGPKTEQKPDIAITAEMPDEELDRHIKDSTQGMTAQQIKRFQKLTYETRGQKRELGRVPELEAKIKELEARPPQKDEEAVAALRKELDTYKRRIDEQETELGGVRIEKSKMYLDEVATPMAEIEAQFREFAESYDVAADDLIALTGLKGIAQDEKFEELTVGWAKRKADTLGALLDRHAVVTKKQSEIRAKGKQGYDSFLQQQKEQDALKRSTVASERAEALPKVWSESVVASAPFLKERDGDAEWNTSIAKTQDFIRQADDQWFAQQPTAERVRLTAQAAALPLVMRHYEAEGTKQRDEIARLTARIEELKGSAATVTSGGTVERDAATEAEKDANMTLTERIAKMVNAK